mmetsp:Transcript_55315/g.91603  ORF Transcript_55315/g.91603 Transcript_55315/m.91603 type:complete len:284 (-) Transcript_55315:231-1082(-)|eukprot:CAMPEP_0119336616 /NCGR_PEP_ID=MMETSP1333-20130426/92223_1 /TAXON_ID=418940 /ORGANISM="Scyphosphaera apsteinii, Strain RCC1455" /LENGTH=283 /DNA_ID=CAMNT_0007347459 /DNA_START=28 /DNA_END=879 /DNA_ORIENTATION=+
MQLTLVAAGKKYEVDVMLDDTVLRAKQRAELLCGIPALQQRWLVKGKNADSSALVSTLGLNSSAKIMVLRTQTGHASESKQPAATESAEISTKVNADRDSHDTRSPASTVGQGNIALHVSNGKHQIEVRCQPSDTVLDLKGLLESVVTAPPKRQRLILRGKEVNDTQSVSELGLLNGGKFMLLFREAHHKNVEGQAAVAAAVVQIAAVREQLEQLERRAARRLEQAAELLAAVGVLDEKLTAISQDLRNADVSGEQVAKDRQNAIKTAEELVERVHALRGHGR